MRGTVTILHPKKDKTVTEQKIKFEKVNETIKIQSSKKKKLCIIFWVYLYIKLLFIQSNVGILISSELLA